MAPISIFYFNGHQLIDSELLSDGDLLDAIDRAIKLRSDYRSEIWMRGTKMGEIDIPAVKFAPI
ncbi:MAG: hypothetical protein HKO13_09170 [Sphingomonas sp.]|nr:hypothetical protein [Sphingomonas sp.]